MILQPHSRQFIRALKCTSHSRFVTSLANSSSSSRKLNMDFSWPFPDFRRSHTRYWEFKSRITIFLVGMAGRTLLSVFNKTIVHNKEALLDAIYARPPGVPLITVSNHDSCMDDPGLLALSGKQLTDQKNMRWSLAAHDICFTRPIHTSFFSFGKCIPTVRGLGVYQRSVDFAIDRLNSFGDWLHIFPEGRVNVERAKLYRLKWGVGRIISELKTTPIVIPFHHIGMSDVLPNRKPYIPRFGNKVFMNVGAPLKLEPVLENVKDLSPRDKRKAITDFIQGEMEKLRLVTLKLSDESQKSAFKS